MLFEHRNIKQVLLSALLSFLFFGCQPTVYLMPTPSVLSTGEHNPYAVNPNLEQSNRVPVLYATNRRPRGNSGLRTYSIRLDRHLHLGVADLRIGSQETTWDKLYNRSTSAEVDRGIVDSETEGFVKIHLKKGSD